MSKITYNNKVAIESRPEIANENKVRAEDMNEIKQIVNENDDKFLTNGLNVSNEVDEDYRVNVLHSKNLFDISNLKDLNNIASISNISNGVKCTNNSGGNTMILLVAKDVSNYVGKTFTFKANWTGNAGIVLGLCDVNGGNRIQGAVGNTSGQSISYTIPTLDAAKYLYARLTIGQTQNDSANFTNIMLNEGSTALPYEPYITPSIYVDNEEIYSKDNIDIYSTNEIRIGTWIDGKPIYRTVYEKNNTTAGNTSYSIAPPSNLRVITKLDIMQYAANEGSYIHDYYNSSSDYLRIFYSSQVIQVRTSKTSSYNHYITIEYTKTTD